MEGNKEEIINLDKVITPNEEKEEDSNPLVPINTSFIKDSIDIDVDTDFLDEDINEEISEDTNDIQHTYPLPNEEDTFLIIIQEDEDIIDKIINVHKIEIDQSLIHFKDEDENDISLFIDEDKNIILHSDDYNYTITTFEKLQEIDIKDLESNENNIFITKELYPEIELNIEERKEKIYSIQERKESLITELISLLNAYDNKPLILTICDIADHYISMINNNKNKSFDYSDILPFLKDVQKENYQIPNWIIPIVDNIKNIYNNEDDPPLQDYDDNQSLNLNNELDLMDKILTTENNTYPKFLKSIINFKPFHNKLDNITIPYDGHYIRDCNDVNPCHNINGEYIFETNKTRKNVSIPLINNNETYYEIIASKENISISGFYTFPHTMYDITYQKNNVLSLFELSILSKLKYSYIPLNKRLIYNEVIPHIIGPDTQKTFIPNNRINSFTFNQFVTSNNLTKTLQTKLPNISDIINSLPKNVLKYIYNYNDVKKALLPYNIHYHIINNENKSMINNIIEKNVKKYIKEYNKTIKRKILKEIEKKDKLLSNQDKIKLSRDYILSILIIPIKNHYIQKFIKRFSREPLHFEDQNYIYEKGSDDKLLCKHYLYSSKIDNDEDAHITMKRLFGTLPKDGSIFCKCCGEYLCHEDFSTLEGISDDGPKNSREILNTSDDSIEELNDKQVTIKKIIQKITSIINIKLTDYDNKTIIKYFDTINNDDLIDIRYKNTNSLKKHPKYKEIKKKYKFIKPAKSIDDRENNKKNMKLLDKDISGFKEYLNNSNELLIITFLILFLLQVSDPPYTINNNNRLVLWDDKDFNNSPWNKLSNTIHTKISIKSINTIFKTIEQISIRNKKDIFWNNINHLLNEEKLYPKLAKVKSQFIHIAGYILTNSKIRTLLKNYYNLKNNIQSSVYLKEYWSTYKPIYDNQTIIDINNQINQDFKESSLEKYLLKKGTNIQYENISTILPINEVYTIPKNKRLNIPYLDILRNNSYIKLLDYSLHLHGKSGEISSINLLIDRFINTIEDKNKNIIEKIFTSIGWNKQKKSLQNINYNDLREALIDNIQGHFKKENPEEKNTIHIFNHIKINNWNGMLLNSYPKRFYSYTPPNVLPSHNFDKLKEIYDSLKKEKDNDKLNILQSLFKKYCINEQGSLHKKISQDDFILNIVADPSFERDIICNNILTINKENYYKIIKYISESNKLPRSIDHLTHTVNIYEKRLYDFINTNNLLDYPADNYHSILTELHNLYDISISDNNPSFIKQEYRKVFNKLEEYKNNSIQNIKSFIIKSSNESIIHKDQLKYYKNYRVTLDKLDTYLNNYLNNFKNIENNINDILFIIGKLSNNPIELKDTILSDNIPKDWKLNDSNSSSIQSFINNKEFLLHNDIFIDSHKYNGFYRYLSDPKYSVCFTGLLSYIQTIYTSGIHHLTGNNKSYYTETYHQIFIKFLFTLIIDKIIEYIDSLYDEKSLSSQKAIELFLILKEKDELQLSDSINICSQLLFDLLIHFLDENIDPNWIFQTDNLSDKLSKQKETEKQLIINELEGKTKEERAVTIELQKQGQINWWLSSSGANLKSDNYEEELDNERLSRIKENLIEEESRREAVESLGINLNNLPTDISPTDDIGENAYIQNDQDREDEGLDDADDDGDYKEN